MQRRRSWNHNSWSTGNSSPVSPSKSFTCKISISFQFIHGSSSASAHWCNRLHVSIGGAFDLEAWTGWLEVESGGSILTSILNSKHQSIKDLEISVLVRGEDKAKALKALGVNPILFRDLDDSEALTKAASEHDSKSHPSENKFGVDFVASCDQCGFRFSPRGCKGACAGPWAEKKSYRKTSVLFSCMQISRDLGHFVLTQ